MMYDKSSGFVIAILHKGKVLREVGNEVFLPFDSEYSIRIKNPHSFRVCFDVLIDGTEITDNKIILPGNSSIDLERMIVDGDLNKGPRFKFVSREGGNRGEQLSDPTSNLNGLIEVRFYHETRESALRHAMNQSPYRQKSPLYYTDPFPFSSGMGGVHTKRASTPVRGFTPDYSHCLFSAHAPVNSADGANFCSEQIVSASAQCSLLMDWMETEKERSATTDASQIGGTVAGSTTTQKFSVDNTFENETCAFASLRLWIRGKKEPVLVKDTRHKFCTSCGYKIKLVDRFCGRCGRQVSAV